MFFYFEQLFRSALTGINGTAVPQTMLQIAAGILIVALLFNVYEAWARGGDVRTLAVGAIKYLIVGLILLNYSQVFLAVNTMFNQVAEYISQVGPGGVDVFKTWGQDIVAFVTSGPSFKEGLFGFVIGTPTALLSGLLILIG